MGDKVNDSLKRRSSEAPDNDQQVKQLVIAVQSQVKQQNFKNWQS